MCYLYVFQAKTLEKKYLQEFQSLLGNRKESDMEDMADALLAEGKSYKGIYYSCMHQGIFNTCFQNMQNCVGSRQLNRMPQSVLDDELEGIQWHIKVLQERIKTCKGRNIVLLNSNY